MNFDNLLEVAASGGEVTIPATWAQGRASFGGVTAALEAEILRDGKAVSQVLGRIVLGGEPRLMVLAIFGARRLAAVQGCY